jgi:hypothetical protein
MSLRPRAVIVHRRTELVELLERHGTRGQVEFFMRTRGRTLAQVESRHDAAVRAREAVYATIPSEWAVAEVERRDLPRFLLAKEDLVVVVGQDGLVANAAKYLNGQLIIGVNPEPGINPGVLVRHNPTAAARLLRHPDSAQVVALTMARAQFDDGQELTALNEVYVGHASHQSARYELTVAGGEEKVREEQSSSGLIVGTGTGASGWCASIAGDRGGRRLPGPTDRRLAWFVREAWPSPVTGTSLTEGVLGEGQDLAVTVKSDQLVVFGDGIEADRLTATWGQRITLGLSDRQVRLAA